MYCKEQWNWSLYYHFVDCERMGECTGHVRRKKIKVSVLGIVLRKKGGVNLICGTKRTGKIYIYIYIVIL